MKNIKAENIIVKKNYIVDFDDWSNSDKHYFVTFQATGISKDVERLEGKYSIKYLNNESEFSGDYEIGSDLRSSLIKIFDSYVYACKIVGEYNNSIKLLHETLIRILPTYKKAN